MNRRTLKKHCKRAVPILIAEYGYHETDFMPADGSETIDAPTRMERQYVERGFLKPGALRGTMIIWQRTSYEYDEWDCKLASELLDEIRWVEKQDWSPTDCEEDGMPVRNVGDELGQVLAEALAR